MSANTELLKVAGLQMRFGGLLAVDGIDFDVRRDEVFAIIGPNGAGKTTVFNCVGGFQADRRRRRARRPRDWRAAEPQDRVEGPRARSRTSACSSR